MSWEFETCSKCQYEIPVLPEDESVICPNCDNEWERKETKGDQHGNEMV